MNMKHLEYLNQIATADVNALNEKEKTYQGSWKKRGGVGAFMMMARKWDRIETMLGSSWDIFKMMRADASGNDGTMLAEVRDLRRYLLLVEAEMLAQQFAEPLERLVPREVNKPGTPEDGGHHARHNDYMNP